MDQRAINTLQAVKNKLEEKRRNLQCHINEIDITLNDLELVDDTTVAPYIVIFEGLAEVL